LAVFLASALGTLAPHSAFAQVTQVQVGSPVVENGWTFYPLPQTVCRRGEPTGIMVRTASASTDKLMITLQGGGACYNLASCAANPSRFNVTSFRAAAQGSPLAALDLTEGIWDTSRSNNRLAAYHHVVIPYCSSDFHAGDNTRVVDGYHQDFKGHQNTAIFFQFIVQQLVPLLSGPRPEVVLAGLSAGGFGAAFNMPRLRALLPSSVKLSLVSDSAPLFDSTVLPGCLQKRWHDTFRFDRTFFTQCSGRCADDEWAAPYLEHLLVASSTVPQALISSTNDSIIQLFTGYMSLFGLCANDPTEAEYTAGLLAIRARMQIAGSLHGTRTASFFVPSTSNHVFLTGDYYEPGSTAQGVAIQTWLERLFDEGPASPPLYWHVGP